MTQPTLTAPAPRTAAVSGRHTVPSRRWRLARHSLALAGRSLTTTRRNPGEAVDAVILPVIFLLVFTYLFGGAVAGSSQEYLQYLFPGVLVLTTVLVGQTATALSIVKDLRKGITDRFRSLPIGRSAPLIGSVLGDAIRYVVAVLVLFGLGHLIGFRVQTGLLATLGAVALAVTFGFCLSWLSVLAAAVLRNETMVATVGFMLPFPLVLGTSMAAPTETMPGWLQAWTEVNPVSHAIEASRGLLLGGPVAESVAMTLLWSAILVVVLAPAAVAAYRRS